MVFDSDLAILEWQASVLLCTIDFALVGTEKSEMVYYRWKGSGVGVRWLWTWEGDGLELDFRAREGWDVCMMRLQRQDPGGGPFVDV